MSKDRDVTLDDILYGASRVLRKEYRECMGCGARGSVGQGVEFHEDNCVLEKYKLWIAKGWCVPVDVVFKGEKVGDE